MFSLHWVLARMGGARRSVLVPVMVSLLLAACGGGGDDGVSPSAPTELPQTLQVAIPSSQQGLGASISFSSNANDPGQALTYRWEFGDGTTSALPHPTHSFSRPGVYAVRLTLSNEAGSSRSTVGTVAVADLAIVQGRSCSGPDSTGWCWQQPLPQGNAINDTTFVDDDHGWAVGENGTVLATSDAGRTWRAQFSGTEVSLSKLAFVNAQVGWVAGSGGELLKTSDAGAVWRRVSSGQSDSVQTLGAADANTAWISTASGRVHITTDGGLSWKRILGPTGFYGRLDAVSASEVWAVPYSWDSVPTLSRSLDGGATWVSVSLPPLTAGLYRYLQDMQFSGSGNALLVASESGYVNSIYVARTLAWRTTDGGASWQSFTLAPSGNANAYQLTGGDAVFQSATYNSAPQFTTDGGTTWQRVNLPSFSNSFVVSSRVFSDRRLMVTDNLGRSYLSSDRGANWSLRGATGSATGTALSSVWFFDSREGLAIGANGSSLRTTDGGQSWVGVAPVGYNGWRRAQFSASGNLGWVISDSDTLYRSSDKGRTWLSPVAQSSALLYGVSDFHFPDELNGWAISPYPYGQEAATIHRSSDGGMSWQPVPGSANLQGFVSLRFADATHGIAVGPAGIALVTTDGGVTWSPRPTGLERNLARVTFVDANTAVAVGDGGAIVRSTDRGQTWSKVDSPTAHSLRDVRFVSTTTGHAVGTAGTLLTTRDGGVSWAMGRSGARTNLQSVFFVDERTGWVVSDNGSILATVSGGR